MTISDYEKSKSSAEFSSIRRLIYGNDPSIEKDRLAIAQLKKLADIGMPYAMLLQALFMWHGYGFDIQDPEKAYFLASQAAELGDMDALVVLASMHFVGYGCEQSFEKSIFLLNEFDSKAETVPAFLTIGAVSLGYFDFRKNFVSNINGVPVSLPIDLLEEFNRWVLSCKRKVIAKQKLILDKNPAALGGITYRKLPFKGAIGGSRFSLKGEEYISHIGFFNDWINEEIWFSTDDLVGWPSRISFHELYSFQDLATEELLRVGKSYLDNYRKGKIFELQLSSTSVHHETKLFSDNKELISIFVD